MAAASVRRLLPELASLETVTIRTDGDRLSLSSGGAEMVATVVPAAFPDYESVMLAPPRVTALVIERRELLDALQRFASEFAGMSVGTDISNADISNAGVSNAGVSNAVLLTATEAGLRLWRGDVTLHVDATITGRSVEVSIDPGLGIECVSGAIGPEVIVEIEDDPLRPVVFRSATDGTYASLLMPVKQDAPGRL